MTIERKVGMGIAGQPTGPAADVAEVFSTYLYGADGTAKTITNGIDLAGEGGLVWSSACDAVSGGGASRGCGSGGCVSTLPAGGGTLGGGGVPSSSGVSRGLRIRSCGMLAGW